MTASDRTDSLRKSDLEKRERSQTLGKPVRVSHTSRCLPRRNGGRAARLAVDMDKDIWEAASVSLDLGHFARHR